MCIFSEAQIIDHTVRPIPPPTAAQSPELLILESRVAKGMGVETSVVSPASSL